MKYTALGLFLFFLVSCKSSNKNIDPNSTTQTSTNNQIVYGGTQKDNQYLTKIIGEYLNYNYLQKDSVLLVYNKDKQLISSVNYQFRSGGTYNTNGFEKKYETLFTYGSNGNLIQLISTDLQYNYSNTLKFEYDEKNLLYKINGISRTGNYSEFVLKLETTDKGFNVLRNGFLKSENTISNDNLLKYYEKDSPITFEYQDYKVGTISPFYALPQNMQKIFFSTENNIYFFLLSLEEMNCFSKNIPTKIEISGAFNANQLLNTKTDKLGYATELWIGDLSTSVYKKYKFSYN